MTDKTDALVARVWEAIGTYSVQVATTGELAPSTALREAIEALAAPAEGGQGEATLPAASVSGMTLGQRAVAFELLRCCESWEPGVRVMGNVKASDAADLLRWLIDSAGGAKELPASMYGLTHGKTGSFDHTKPPPGVRPDSHGVITGSVSPQMRDESAVTPTMGTPQPAEGDGASPTTVRFIDGGIVQMDRADYDKLTRPSAAAAVPEIRSCRDAFESYIAKDGGDLRTFGFGQTTHYSNSAVNNAWSGWQAGVKWAAAAPAAQASAGVIGDAIRHLSKWLDQNDCECESGHQCGRAEVEQTRNQLLALAQQEPRHDALADGEAASR